MNQTNSSHASEVQRHALAYKGNEQAWQFVNGVWQTNDEGHMIVPAAHVHSREPYLAFNSQRSYRDCVVTAKFRILYAGGALPELIVRSQDSRRFYAVRVAPQMTSVWKGSADGYRRMLGYRRGADSYQRYMDKWCDVRVECVDAEILVFVEDSFVMAVRDEEYPTGVVGVACAVGRAAWNGVVVEGQPDQGQPDWYVVDGKTPQQITLFRRPTPGGMGAVNAYGVTLLPGQEVFVSCGMRNADGMQEWITRGRDLGRTWDEPILGRGGRYMPSRKELWWFDGGHMPQVVANDDGTHDFSFEFARSKDAGRTWSPNETLRVPFPAGRAYSPLMGKASAILGLTLNVGELQDGSIAFTGEFWRSKAEEWEVEGDFRSSQVEFIRTTDGGKIWSIHPIDAMEWQRNESSWVEMADGELVCVMRSDQERPLGFSRSKDSGQTWSRIQPIVGFFGASNPALLRTSDNVLLLAGRSWGLMTSVDEGRTWGLPTYIGGYSGSGWPAHMQELPDGRILVVGDDDEQLVKAQFITVDRHGMIHPAPAN